MLINDLVMAVTIIITTMNNSETLIFILMCLALAFGSYDIAKEYVLRKYKNNNTIHPEKIKVRIVAFTITYVAFILGASFTISLMCR